MASLRPCPALALGVLFACARQHEGGAVEGDPAQIVAGSESDDSAETDDSTSASSTNPTSEDEPGSVPPAAGEPTPPPMPVSPPPPASSPVPGVFPSSGQVCARQTFDSLTPTPSIQVPQPCTYWVTGWPKVGDPKLVRVMIDGRTVLLGQADGWKIADDNDGITLLGTACEAAQAGASIAITNECQLPIWI